MPSIAVVILFDAQLVPPVAGGSPWTRLLGLRYSLDAFWLARLSQVYPDLEAAVPPKSHVEWWLGAASGPSASSGLLGCFAGFSRHS